ncbi:MAG: permease-like cell division protein FtsX [Candidatus Levybacteria bacterium]|nr:permease-like cell division protein FtsX [Candidatus Levybacteria bacterium]
MKSFRTAWKHIRRSPYQAFAAVFIIMQTFFVASLFTFVIFGSAKIITYFESLPQVTAFFKNEATQEKIDDLRSQIESSNKVSSTKFVSKQDALRIYKQKFKDDPLLLEFVTADILPASLEISTTNIKDLSEISNALQNTTIIKEVVFPKDIVTNLTNWTDALRKIGLALILVLSLDSIFIMIIIIGIKISQKKDEIEIMRLLGATNWYIRWPFVLEGMLYGMLGAVVGWSLSVGLIFYAGPFLSSFLQGIQIFPISWLLLLEFLGIELMIAAFLGIFSSLLAVLRYLK